MPLSDSLLRKISGKNYNGKPELRDRDGLSAQPSAFKLIGYSLIFSR